MIKSVMVIGATQGTGVHVVRRLLAKNYVVTIIARNIEKAQSLYSGMPVTIKYADITRIETLNRELFLGIDAIIWTVGVTRRPASEALIRSTEYEGVRSILQTAAAANYSGRFIYMTSIGVERRSLMGMLLNTIKRNTLIWRRKAEALIRASNLPYTIVRAGILNDQAASSRRIRIDQHAHGAGLQHRISRADVAHVLVDSLSHHKVLNTSFNIYWGDPAGEGSKLISSSFDGLVTGET